MDVEVRLFLKILGIIVVLLVSWYYKTKKSDDEKDDPEDQFDDHTQEIFMGKSLSVETESVPSVGDNLNFQYVDAYGGDTDDLKVRLAQFLGCPCLYLPPCESVADIIEFYENQRKTAGKFTVPLLIGVNQELYDTMCHNADPEFVSWERSEEQVLQFRESILSRKVKKGSGEDYLLNRGYKSDLMELLPQSNGKFGLGQMADLLIDPSTEKTVPLLLAQIPVDEAWKVFAWAPCSGNLDLPLDDLLSVACYWKFVYSAVPMAILNPSTIFFYVTDMEKVKRKSKRILCEHSVVCPNLSSEKDLSFYLYMLENLNVWTFKNS